MNRRSLLTGIAVLPLSGVLGSRPSDGSHIHTPGDGRPLREVFVDGVQVKYAFYADTQEGIVRVYRHEGERILLDREKREPLSMEIRGRVIVRPMQG